ncbi:MAG: S41 family peptidase [Chloroflexota bacterium]
MLSLRGRAKWSRVIALLTVGLALLVGLAGCSAGASSQAPSRTGNARVSPADEGSRPPGATAPGATSTDGLLSSTELGVVYQYILQRYVDQVDHTVLVESAIAGVHETGVKSNALPLDLAPTDLVPLPSGDPNRDWNAFVKGYDALVGKYPEWAASARPDWAVLRKMLASLNDDHSSFIDPQELKRMNETSISGIGVTLARMKPDDPPYIKEVFRDSPASSAGVKAGDQILGIDGTPTSGRSLIEVMSAIRGTQGTKVVLSVARGGPPLDVQVTRGTVDLPLVDAAVRGVLGLIKIRTFREGVPEQVEQALVQGRNRGARAWIVDLRGNTGGQLRTMARVAVNFIENRPVGLAVDRSGQRAQIAAPSRPVVGRFPYVVLVDHETSSAAELLAAAIKEYQIAPIVGLQTAGSVGLAEPQSLSDGSQFQLTIGRLLSPRGNVIDRQGVTPDVEAEVTLDDLQKGEDPPMMRALELFAGGAVAPPAVGPSPSPSPAPRSQ